jgi:hypothetical protein
MAQRVHEVWAAVRTSSVGSSLAFSSAERYVLANLRTHGAQATG